MACVGCKKVARQTVQPPAVAGEGEVLVKLAGEYKASVAVTGKTGRVYVLRSARPAPMLADDVQYIGARLPLVAVEQPTVQANVANAPVESAAVSAAVEANEVSASVVQAVVEQQAVKTEEAIEAKQREVLAQVLEAAVDEQTKSVRRGRKAKA